MASVGENAEKLAARIRARFPHVPLLVAIYVALQFFWQVWKIGGDMIDAYSHAQFFAAHADQIAQIAKSAAQAVFSSTGSIVTFVIGLSYLALDRRVARLEWFLRKARQ